MSTRGTRDEGAADRPDLAKIVKNTQLEEDRRVRELRNSIGATASLSSSPPTTTGETTEHPRRRNEVVQYLDRAPGEPRAVASEPPAERLEQRAVFEFMRKEGIRDPVDRSALYEAGLFTPLDDCPKILEAFRFLVAYRYTRDGVEFIPGPGRVRSGRRSRNVERLRTLRGRLGNVETRVALLMDAITAVREGYRIQFEVAVPGGPLRGPMDWRERWLDLVVYDAKGTPIRGVQGVKQDAAGRVHDREQGLAARIEERMNKSLKLGGQFKVKELRTGMKITEFD